MASIRELAFKDVLNKANAGLAGADVFERSRMWGVVPSMVPKRIAYAFQHPNPDGIGDEVLDHIGGLSGSVKKRAAWAAFEIIWKGDGAIVPDEAIDGELIAIAKKIVGQKVSQLYIGVEDMGIALHRAQADYPYLRAIQWVRIHYMCQTADPEKWA